MVLYLFIIYSLQSLYCRIYGKHLQEDPSLSYYITEDTEEIVLRGMGAFHLEIAISRLETEHRIKDIFQYPMRIG